MRRFAGSLLLLSLATTLSCSRASPTGVSVAREVREPSGLTTSPSRSGVYWTHGDSGTGNWIFAIDASGKLLARVRVTNAQNIDWEDITHDDDGHLWLGDIGNNDSGRRDLVVHRLAEPSLDATETTVERKLGYHFADQTSFVDQSANFDSEALFWWRGQLWLLTKHRSDDLTRLYRFPALEGEGEDEGEIAIEFQARFDMGPSFDGERKPWSCQVSGAEVSPDEKYLAMLSYDAVFVFETPSSGDATKMFDKLVTRIGFDPDYTRQVEALTWDEQGLLLVNEDREVFRISEPLTATKYP